MMRRFILLLFAAVALSISAGAQKAQKLYNESIDPVIQIDKALKTAQKGGKFVICQVGGNWCPWCIRFADFITSDEDINKAVSENFVYIHVNYPRRGASTELSERLGSPARFGFPVMVVLNEKGEVIHIQDSSFLESGQSYDKEKVLRFFNNWTPKAVNGE